MTTSATTEAIAELARRVEITCKARYHAARRLNSHNWFSQWTLALLAVGQITLAVVSALKLPTNFSQSQNDFGAIFFGVLVLAYSLLLGMSNFAARAVKIHECGLELGRLVRKLYFAEKAGSLTQQEYDELSSHYYNVLDKHENHTRTDYLVAHFEYYQGRGYRKDEEPTNLDRVKLFLVRLKIYLFHALGFSHYVISLALLAGWSYYLLAGAV